MRWDAAHGLQVPPRAPQKTLQLQAAGFFAAVSALFSALCGLILLNAMRHYITDEI